MFDLDTTEDPAWFYLDSQHQWITGLMKETFDTAIQKINRVRAEDGSEDSSIKRSLTLKKAISQIPILKEMGSEEEKLDIEQKVWRATSDLVKSLSSLLLRCLPDFWRLSKAFIEGKFANKTSTTTISSNRKRRQGMDMNKVEQCQRMTRDIIDQYVSLLSDYFSLDQKQLEMQKVKDGSERCIMPSFVPVNANSVYTSEYLTLIIGDLATCVNDINNINLAGEAFSGLTNLMEKARSKFIDIVCKCWERGM